MSKIDIKFTTVNEEEKWKKKSTFILSGDDEDEEYQLIADHDSLSLRELTMGLYEVIRMLEKLK
jgi:hypothetical protein